MENIAIDIFDINSSLTSNKGTQCCGRAALYTNVSVLVVDNSEM